MRAKFEENRGIRDMRIACELIEEAEKELAAKQHWQPKKCKETNSIPILYTFYSYKY